MKLYLFYHKTVLNFAIENQNIEMIHLLLLPEKININIKSI